MSFKPSGEAIVGSEIQKETLLQKNHLYVDKTTKTTTIPVTRFPYQQVVLPLGYKSNQFKLQRDIAMVLPADSASLLLACEYHNALAEKGYTYLLFENSHLLAIIYIH